jgi:hypothetical protein
MWTAPYLLVLPAQVESQGLSITGRVIDSINREPVSGATVNWNGGAPTTTTNAQGLFTLSGPVSVVSPDSNSTLHFSSPFLSAGHIRFATRKSSQTVIVSVYNIQGKTISTRRFSFKQAGWHNLPIFSEEKDFFIGFVSLHSDDETYRFKVMHQSDPVASTIGEYIPQAPQALAKTSIGTVSVSIAGLNPGSVAVKSDTMNVGDIVLGYPARPTIGVGARTPWGATILFDGSQGRVAANSEMQAKWQDWPRYSPSPIKFRIARDPQYLSDTNRVTLQSCCNTLWGYDDIQAKVGLFQDMQVHVEFIGMGAYDTPNYDTLTPNANAGDPMGKGQPGYINSGVYIASRYEVQIQSWSTSPTNIPGNHDMGGIVDQFTPTSNQNKANGVWQSYDVTYRGARFTDTVMTTPPYMSVWWNGVLVHDNRVLGAGASGFVQHSGEEHKDTALYGLKLQSEGRDVRYRNVWVKKLNLPAAQTNLGF